MIDSAIVYQDDKICIGLKKHSVKWSKLKEFEIEFVIKNTGSLMIDSLQVAFPFDPRMNKQLAQLAPNAKTSFSEKFDGSTIFDLLPTLQLSYS